MKLKVLSTKALVPDYRAFADGVMRFIGQKHDASVGKNGGYVRQDEPVEVKFCKEYLEELKAGTLLPADQETAKLAGVSFTKEKGNK